jgi:hypothetical protein
MLGEARPNTRLKLAAPGVCGRIPFMVIQWKKGRDGPPHLTCVRTDGDTLEIPFPQMTYRVNRDQNV